MMIHWGEETSLCSWPVLWATKLGSYLQAKSWQAQGSAHWCLFVWFTHHWGGAVSREHQEFWLGRHPWWHALLFLQGELLISSDSMGNCLLQASILVCIDGLQILDSFLTSSFWTEQRLLRSLHFIGECIVLWDSTFISRIRRIFPCSSVSGRWVSAQLWTCRPIWLTEARTHVTGYSSQAVHVADSSFTAAFNLMNFRLNPIILDLGNRKMLAIDSWWVPVLCGTYFVLIVESVEWLQNFHIEFHFLLRFKMPNCSFKAS